VLSGAPATPVLRSVYQSAEQGPTTARPQSQHAWL